MTNPYYEMKKFITHNKLTRMFAVFENFVKFSEIRGHFNK